MDAIDYQQIKMALRDVLREEGIVGDSYIANRWAGGTVSIKPGNTELAAKDIPIEDFFHKIIMIRDRLRVLEQKVNGSDELSRAGKVGLQQYITRCYGSLTTFNVLFRDKEDQFVGESSARRKKVE